MLDINAILRADPRSAKHGAPMGDSDTVGDLARLHLQRLRFVGGDYGADGTYWGSGTGTNPVWCAFNEEGTTRIYVRAADRDAADVRLFAR